MNTPFKTLEQIFFDKKKVPLEELSLLFDAAGIPVENCWRTIYRVIFDVGMDANSDLEKKISRGQFESLMKRALDNARNNDFTDMSLTFLIREYDTANFLNCHNQLTDVINELDKLTNEFKSMSMERENKVNTLESDTVSVVESDLSIEEKVALIKSKFKKTINMFQQDVVKLDQMTNTDHLTGLYNRRFFDEQLDIEVFQARSEKTWLNLLMIDIDDFKLFNDTFGHQVGDQALKTIAKIIRVISHRESAKTGMYIFPTRYGGEEFAIILPASDKKQALAFAEKIRTKISQYTFVLRNKQGKITRENIALTVSIGVAALDHSHEKKQGIKLLVSDADTAMYEAKKTGKNCVRVTPV